MSRRLLMLATLVVIAQSSMESNGIVRIGETPPGVKLMPGRNPTDARPNRLPTPSTPAPPVNTTPDPVVPVESPPLPPPSDTEQQRWA